MAKKVKIKKSLYTTLFEDYHSSGGYDGTRHKKTKQELEEERLKIWDSIINRKKVEIKKINGKSALEQNSLKISPYKMKEPIPVKIKDAATGEVHEEMISAPAEIIAVCQKIREAAERSQLFGILMKRFNKPIIWTINSAIQTAASDGIRIAYNVVFAYQLLTKGKADYKAMQELGNQPKGSDAMFLTIGKYWLFVYIHETYHELYRHQEQAERKKETSNGKNHDMSNVAMDAEINRDIEEQFSLLKGCTAAINGIMDKNFPVETWDEIFDEYYYNNKKMPDHEQPPMQSDNSSMDDMEQPPMHSNIDDSDNDSDNDQNNNANSDSNSDDLDNEETDNMNGNNSDQSDNSDDGDMDDTQSDDNAENGNNSSNSKDPSAPNTDKESDEYSDAYNDELKKISEEMQNKNKSKSDNNSEQPIDMSEQEQEDLVQQIKDAIANGADLSDMLDVTGSSSKKLSQKTSDELMQKLAEQLPDEMRDLKEKVKQKIQDQTEGNMSATERAAREQARKDIEAAMKEMEEQAAMEDAAENDTESSEPGEEKQAGKGSSMTPTVTTSSKFGGQDLSTRDILSEIAAEEGQPYTAEELTANVKEINDTFTKENLDGLKSANAALGQKVENIANKLKDVTVIANWKAKLRLFLKNVSQGEITRTQSRRTMSQTWRDDRYMPYKSKPQQKEFGAADLFYLIDNSGSMWGAGFGEGIFLQIFGEILGIERACDIQNSALTYFSGDNIIDPANIRLWNKKTPKGKVLDMIGQKSSDRSGGTDIGGNVIAVTNLKKPYYSARGEKHTLLLVFTDGEDYAQYKQIAAIPARVKRDILFCLINRRSTIVQQIENLKTISGVNIKNIIAICTDEYTNK